MLPRREHDGRVWIDERLFAAAMAQGLPIPRLEWQQTTDDLEASAETLTVTIESRSKELRLSEADLDRLPHEAAVQERVADLLAALLDSFAAR